MASSRVPEGLYKRKDSKYYWTKINGNYKSTKTHRLSEAREILEQRRKENIGIANKKILVSKYFKEFEEYYEQKVVKKHFKTITGYIKIFINKQNIEYLHEIKFNTVDDFLINKSKSVSAKTVIDYKTALNVFLKYAIKRGHIKENPVQKIEVQKAEKTAPFFFTQKQIKDMLKKSKGSLHTYILISVFTGVRFSECIRLKWKDVDFEEGLIYVHKAKTKRFRAIPMHKTLKTHLEKIKRKSGYILNTYQGKNYVGYTTMRERFEDLLKKCKIDTPKGVLLHALRHSCASWLVMNGVNIYSVKEILGHSTVTTTQRYSHLNQDFLKKEMRKLKF